MVATETETSTVSKRKVCVLLESFLVNSFVMLGRGIKIEQRKLRKSGYLYTHNFVLQTRHSVILNGFMGCLWV